MGKSRAPNIGNWKNIIVARAFGKRVMKKHKINGKSSEGAEKDRGNIIANNFLPAEKILF